MNKRKTFSFLVRVFIISVLILFTFISVSSDIYFAKKEFNISVTQLKKNFLNEKKELIKSNVNAVVKIIDQEEKSIVDFSKRELKKRVNVIYKIINNLHKKIKNEEIIIETIKSIKPANFFVVKLDGKCLLFPEKPYFEGKNLLKILNPKERKVVESMIRISKTKGEGFISYYWSTYDNKKEKRLKISFIKYFKPLDLFLGSDLYIDEIDKKTQEFIKNFLNNYRFGKYKTGYIFLLKLLNINGGKNFAIMLVNPNRPDLTGKYLSDDYKDAKGKEFRKEFLKGLREKGECFVYYWYKKFNNKKPSPKLTYFKLTNDKKYIVAAGIYLDDLNKEIYILKSNLKKRIKRDIVVSSSITTFFLIIFLIIFNQLDKYMRKEFNNFILMLKTSLESNKEVDESKIKFLEFYIFNKYIGYILQDYKALFEKCGIAMLIMIDYKFIECNEIAVKLLGYEKKEELMLNIGEHSPENQPDGENSKIKAKKFVDEVLLTGKTKIFQWKLKRKDGSCFWAIVNLSLIPFRNRKAVLVTWLDISELKEMEEKLINEKERLAVTLLSIGDAVITVDTKKRVQLMNKIAETLTGFPFSEAKNKAIEEIFNVVDESTGEKIENPVTYVLNKGCKKELTSDILLISKKGEKFNISLHVTPIRDRESKIIGAILVFRDESEKIKMRKELMKIDRLKSISLLAGGIAHDFNNLLTGIYANLELALIHCDEKTKNYILKAISSIERARNLTTQLLTFSKGGEPILKNVDIVSIIKQVTEFNISGSNVSVIYKIDKNIWHVKADKGQLSQVISNIIINAKQAMPTGGNILIEINNVFIEGNKFVEIKISDDGIGIPENILDRIFDPYFTTKSEGSGLGLSIVYSIIKKHGGEINVESKPGEGTTFKIYLPALDNQKKIAINKNVDDIKVFQKERKVLIMDDEQIIRDVNKEIFETFGFKVELAKNGEEAIEKFKKERFDIIIMDLTVKGGMGGKEAIKEILKIDKNAKVIVSSGYNSDPIMANYKEYGFKASLSKPFKIEELKKILKLMEEEQ